jgi:uncharacterized membrane protein
MRPSSHALEHWVHRVLLAGLSVSAALLMAGLATTLATDQESLARHDSLWALVRAAARLDGQALTVLGLLALMITPILRVIVLAIGWSLERNWRFAAVAFVVLITLAVSMTLGAS